MSSARPIILAPDVNGNILGIVPLTQGQQSIIDLEDVPEIGKNNWQIQKSPVKHVDRYYAYRSKYLGMRNGKKVQKTIMMHRIVMGDPKDLDIDHLNGDGLDNRRSNLRAVSNRENCQNRHHEKTSKYPGVNWDNHFNKWKARISLNNELKHLGLFNTELEAYGAYKRACIEINEGKSFEELTQYLQKTSSKFKGVSWNKNANKWKAAIMINGKTKHLGYFSSEVEASRAYQKVKGGI